VGNTFHSALLSNLLLFSLGRGGSHDFYPAPADAVRYCSCGISPQHSGLTRCIFFRVMTLSLHFQARKKFVCLQFGSASEQSVAIHGWLRCNNNYAGGVPIKLWDKDTVDPDDLMSEGHSSAGGPDNHKPEGFFNISGVSSEITKIDPELRIYHSCTEGGDKQICSKIIIPQSYITDGSAVPKLHYNAEVITLEDKVNDCT